MGHETVIVLGGAKSAAENDLSGLRARGFVIGVNDSAIHAPVDAAVTMDRTWFEHRWSVIKAFSRQIPLHARAEAVINVTERWPNLHIFACDRLSNAMSDEKGRLNGVNSGFCALNLAWQMRPKQIIVLGIDAKRDGYWYPPYEWQRGEKPRGITSDWAYKQWEKGLADIRRQFTEAGIEWI